MFGGGYTCLPLSRPGSVPRPSAAKAVALSSTSFSSFRSLSSASTRFCLQRSSQYNQHVQTGFQIGREVSDTGSQLLASMFCPTCAAYSCPGESCRQTLRQAPCCC